MKEFRHVTRETRRVAMLNPLGHNTANVYVTAEDEPCCIFGHVLKRLNLSGLINVGRFNNYTFADLPWQLWGFKPPTDAERMWTIRVQSAADSGRLWCMSILSGDMPAFYGVA